MWRTIKAIFWAGMLFAGAILGAAFLNANTTDVNIVFPFIGRETGLRPLGLSVLVAMGAGVGVGLAVALFTSLGMTLYAARLKREIRSMKKELDNLRNLPILEEEMGRATDDEDEEEILTTSRGIELAGPVRGGSTAAPIGGDDDDDDNIDHPEDETRLSTGNFLTGGGGTRKLDIP